MSSTTIEDANLSTNEEDSEERREQQEREEREKDLEGRFQRIRASYRNKQRVLVLSSRGITYRYRHLMNDIRDLLPHSKKDVKLDEKHNLYMLNEICELKNCNNCIFFEVRKKQDLYLWIAKVPHGPSIKFHVLNVHTMDELKFTGNALKGSRPILSFDQAFDTFPHYQLMKELFIQVFGTPKGHPKSKPFIDHVLAFFIADNKIWFRNYQITEEHVQKKKTEKALVEIGPRFVLNPVKILAGSFGGPVLFENPHYVSPNVQRSYERMQLAKKYQIKLKQRRQSEKKKNTEELVDKDFEDVFT
jgi:ribosome biogenesis protein BRX1